MSLLSSVNEAAPGETYHYPLVNVTQFETTVATGFTNAAIVYTSGTVTNKVSTQTFIPPQSGQYIVQLGMDNIAINWNGGTSSFVNLQVTDTVLGDFIPPLYCYSTIPPILMSSSPVIYLVAGQTYAIKLQIKAVAQNVDLTACGANRVFANFTIA